MMSSNYIHLPSNHMVSFFLMAELNSNIYIYVFLAISYVFSSTKSENKRVEQVLPGSQGWGKCGR
jgi:hypothetical protein